MTSTHTESLPEATDNIQIGETPQTKERQIVPLVYNTARRFDNKDEKRLFQEFATRTVNKYIGFFITDDNYNYKKNHEYFHYQSEGTEMMLNEIVRWSAALVDRDYADKNKIEPEYWGGTRRYLYLVDEELYNQLKPKDPNNQPPVLSSKLYPGYRIMKSYETFLRFVEFKFHDANIFILSEKALYHMRYMLKAIHLVKSHTLNVEDSERFPFEFYKNMQGITIAPTDGKFNVKESTLSVEEQQAIDDTEKFEEQFANMFSGNAKLANASTKKRPTDTKLFSYNIMTPKRHHSPTTQIKRIAKRAYKHFGEYGTTADLLKVIILEGKYAFIYNIVTEMIVDAMPLTELEWCLAYVDYRAKPYMVAATTTFINEGNTKLHEELQLQGDSKSLTNILLSGKCQIQNR